MRFAMGIEYQGTGYHGYQKQAGLATVAGAVDEALSRVANHAIDSVCAGRTDAGVHASGQVIHFDTESSRTEYNWLLGANSHLPPEIAVRWVKAVPEDFHARYKATSRRYRYTISNTKTRSGLYGNLQTWYRWTLDHEKMHAAAQFLLGTHDFSAFRGQGCQSKTPFKTMIDCQVWREGDLIFLEIQADAFLYHMVRNIVGTLYRIGRGSRSPEWMAEVLASRDRRQAGQAAPAQGLCLIEIQYPSRYNLPNLKV